MDIELPWRESGDVLGRSGERMWSVDMALLLLIFRTNSGLRSCAVTLPYKRKEQALQALQV